MKGKQDLVTLKNLVCEMDQNVEELMASLKYVGRAEESAIQQSINLQKKALRILKYVPYWKEMKDKRRQVYEGKQKKVGETISLFKELPLFEACPQRKREKEDRKRRKEEHHVRFLTYKLNKMSLCHSVQDKNGIELDLAIKKSYIETHF